MITKYTVDTTQIPAGTVITSDIADAAITQPKVKIKTVVALADAAAALTATQMIDSGIFTITPTVARILTTDTAVNIVAGMSGYQVGTWFDITIVNTAAFDVTLAAGVGVTLTGKTIVHNGAATWRAMIDSATTTTFYRTTYDLVDDAVTTAKILNAAVTTAKIADVNVTTIKILDANVTTAKIAALNVTEAKLSASSDYGIGMLRTARARYSFAVDGGAVSTIQPGASFNAVIPDNAIMVGCTINSTTACTSGGSSTISVGTSAGSGTASFLALTAVASFGADVLLNGLATFASPIKMTAAGSITISIAVANLTAGVIEVTVLYFVAAA